MDWALSGSTHPCAYRALHAMLAHDLALPWHQLREHGDSGWLTAMEGMGDDY